MMFKPLSIGRRHINLLDFVLFLSDEEFQTKGNKTKQRVLSEDIEIHLQKISNKVTSDRII